MIKNIRIKSEASFGNEGETINDLAQINFFYGSNGSGKTTISRVIDNEDKYPECSIVWSGGNKLETLVYNRDFVEKNFNADAELKGIFTLGEENEVTRRNIQVAEGKSRELEEEIRNMRMTLSGDDENGGKQAELVGLEKEFEEKFWELKQEYDSDFQEAFTGFRNSKQRFMCQLLQEIKNNHADLLDYQELKDRYDNVYTDIPKRVRSLERLSHSDLVELETARILSKKVVGKEDVNIADMIKKLGNSDWVKQGRRYYDANDDICPFCQQETDEAFARSLDEYFDETYVNDINRIEQLMTDYEECGSAVIQRLYSLLDASSQYLDHERLESQAELVHSKITENKQRLQSKKAEASRVIQLESLTELLEKIDQDIEQANQEIARHNLIVDNIDQEKLDLKSRIWKYVTVKAEHDYDSYNSRKTALERAIENLQRGINDKKSLKTNKDQEIRELEKGITSIQPTVDEINQLLSSLGFVGFSISPSQEKDGYYRIIRSADGRDAKETLSEGERSFVAFLYFYHLLKGSTSESGMTTNRVVVIDDPVSSLDSNTLFVVSTLIKRLFNDVRSGTSQIKQVFVLTHNIYFHKEVTYNPKRTGRRAMNKETFWIVKKIDQCSMVEKHCKNPVKTSYELLWNEVKDQAKDPNRPSHTIQNTLRRILEHYFKILGNINNDEITEKFSGREKQVCGSLFSWVHDGSHHVWDDLYVSWDTAMVEMYLAVFKKIFEKSDHIAHYNMMMGQSGHRERQSRNGSRQSEGRRLEPSPVG